MHDRIAYDGGGTRGIRGGCKGGMRGNTHVLLRGNLLWVLKHPTIRAHSRNRRVVQCDIVCMFTSLVLLLLCSAVGAGLAIVVGEEALMRGRSVWGSNSLTIRIECIITLVKHCLSYRRRVIRFPTIHNVSSRW